MQKQNQSFYQELVYQLHLLCVLHRLVQMYHVHITHIN